MSLDPESFASYAEPHETPTPDPETPDPAQDGNDGDPDAPGLPDLLPQHQALLDASGIAPDVASTRGYCSVRKKVELETLGFDRKQRRVPALLIPLYNAAGEPAGYQARPDQPRVGERGRLVKYELPRGAAMVIDVPPMARARVRDPQVPLFLTEGVRKADAAVSRGLCGVALLGVWNWRDTNACGGRTALADWELFALNGRRVYLAFDSDLMQKREVRAALALLWERREQCPGAVPVIACHDEIVVECDAGQTEAVTVWLRQARLIGPFPARCSRGIRRGDCEWVAC